jgi:acyl-CoA dehydrogenase
MRYDRRVNPRLRQAAAAKAAGVLTCSESISRVIDQATQSCGGDGVSGRLLLASFLTWVRSFRLYEGANQTCTRAISRRCSARLPNGVEIGDVHLANMHGEPAGVL